MKRKHDMTETVGNVTMTEGIAVDRRARQSGLDSSDESQAFDAAQAPDGTVVDNEDDGELDGMEGITGTNVAAMGILMGSTTVTGQIVGSGIVNTEIETCGILVRRQSISKRPPHWNDMTKRQKLNWKKRNQREGLIGGQEAEESRPR